MPTVRTVPTTANRRWLLMDFGDVIVHVFQPEVRQHYDLERLWSEAAVLNFSTSARRKSV